MPVPETCVPEGCGKVSGAATVMVAGPLLGTETTTAVSEFAPVPMAMDSPGMKPIVVATGMTVAPAAVADSNVLAPAVPTVAMTADSKFVPVSTMIFWPGVSPSTLATLRLVAPIAEADARGAAAWIAKSAQLLSVSAPSGKRPALRPGPGAGTRQPLCVGPEMAW
jgi:hypothetical protein